MDSFSIFYHHKTIFLDFFNLVLLIRVTLSQEVQFPSTPRPPLIRATEMRETSLVLKWDLTDNSQDIEYYILHYKDGKSPWLQVVFPTPKRNEYELTNLRPATWYAIYLKSEGKRGPSEPSKLITVKTLGESNDIAIRNFLEPSNFESIDRRVPPYLSSFFVIPISIAIVVVVIVCAASYVYIKKEENKAALIRAGFFVQSPSKNFQFNSGQSPPGQQQSKISDESSLTFRYTDHPGGGKPLMSRPQIQNTLWSEKQGPIVTEKEDFPPYQSIPNHLLAKYPSSPPPPPRNPPPCIPRIISKQASLDSEFMASGSTNSQSDSTHSAFFKTDFLPHNIDSQDISTSSNTQQPSSFCKADVHFDNNRTSAFGLFNYHHHV